MRTTLAAFADNSKSEGRADRAAFTEERRDDERRDISRRHSVTRALKMASVIKSELLVC